MLFAAFKLTIRGMMIAAIILTVLACCGILIGSECTKIMENEKKMKRKIMYACGIAYLVSGKMLECSYVFWIYFKGNNHIYGRTLFE